MEQWLDKLPDIVWTYFYMVPASWWNYALNALVVVFVLICLRFTYYCFRRALGYVKFKGLWYSPEAFHLMKQELYSGVREGRLPDSESMRLLDKHVYGRGGSEIRNILGRYF